MSFLQKLLGKKSNKESLDNEAVSKVNWFPLTSLEQLAEVGELSNTKLIGIFKHSTRCGISATVLKRFSEAFLGEVGIEMYYLDLLTYRKISNEIMNKYNVVHQSPQLLIIKQNEVIKHASHYDILEVNLHEITK